uniref:Uncharacterized protein n=1 Tax=Solanum tuberosum TaxID=4113 RepID=M1DAD9_SOLTU
MEKYNCLGSDARTNGNHPRTVCGVPWFSPRLKGISGSNDETYSRGSRSVNGPTDHSRLREISLEKWIRLTKRQGNYEYPKEKSGGGNPSQFQQRTTTLAPSSASAP